MLAVKTWVPASLIAKPCGACESISYSEITDRVKPLYNIFGHIHEGYGIMTDGVTKYINAASVNV